MDEMTLLREFRSSAPTQAPVALRHRVLQPTSATGPTSTSPRWRLPALASGGIVAAATAIVLAVSAGPSAPPSAAAVLDRAADHVLQGSAVGAPRSDQWIYTRSLDADMLTGRPGTHPVGHWDRVDGSQEAERQTDGPLRVQDVVSNPLGTPLQWYDALRDLPADPQAVLDQLAQDPLFTSHAKTAADRDFDEVTTALTSSTVLPPESVARLYRALASIHGVGVDPNAAPDLVGRTVLSITYTGDFSLGQPGDHWELLLDPHSYRVIGLRGTAGSDHDLKNGTVIPQGTVWYNHADLAQALVDRPGES